MEQTCLEMETISKDSFETENASLEIRNTFVEYEIISWETFQPPTWRREMHADPLIEAGTASLRWNTSIEMSTPDGSIHPSIHATPYFSNQLHALPACVASRSRAKPLSLSQPSCSPRACGTKGRWGRALFKYSKTIGPRQELISLARPPLKTRPRPRKTAHHMHL